MDMWIMLRTMFMLFCFELCFDEFAACGFIVVVELDTSCGVICSQGGFDWSGLGIFLVIGVYCAVQHCLRECCMQEERSLEWSGV
ncbi:hypothetical protein KC19_1G250000 [Ceratodon purpureus]|uniref:NADH dehydrogenase subunit 6 n=1 Tax=Ceratodon purpureus TaxID=3225 RepID=A0A8T0JCH8_CERPU|nr:hypothetical protein KC19_1G250000 [Ceratodon purpureus]